MPPQQFLAGVAGQPARGGVHLDQPQVGVGDGDAVRRVVDQLRVPALGLRELRLDLAPLAQVERQRGRQPPPVASASGNVTLSQ